MEIALIYLLGSIVSIGLSYVLNHKTTIGEQSYDVVIFFAVISWLGVITTACALIGYALLKLTSIPKFQPQLKRFKNWIEREK